MKTCSTPEASVGMPCRPRFGAAPEELTAFSAGFRPTRRHLSFEMESRGCASACLDLLRPHPEDTV